jgi:hypothetical protein
MNIQTVLRAEPAITTFRCGPLKGILGAPGIAIGIGLLTKPSEAAIWEVNRRDGGFL